ncbi:hypothetical protein [Thermocoleostomius sinensis]|uniref:DUF1049 domain-containing protein n=1 Tax=Thermocoleostomius sinensis A174 TaxID=2016057 RepID=A0A9E9C9B0_9CYAN|nr:hypothetical protein [Thermocoleostomius sinensis]WAL62434.1 hypothetical protein OXH18_10715 [Thermocoleostomius sinensis A174]
MISMIKLLLSLILALWVCTIALVAAQNGTRVAIQFLGIQSIQIPFGIMLAFSAAVGMVAMAILLPLLRSTGRPSTRYDREDFE